MDGAKIQAVEGVNLWNPDKQPTLFNDDTAHFDCVTTGGFSAVDLWLDDALTGRLSVRSNFGGTEIDLDPLGRDDHVLETGGLARRIRVFRLPDEDPDRDISTSIPVTLPETGDGRYWAAVTLVDGHRAWSSPIYAFQER